MKQFTTNESFLKVILLADFSPSILPRSTLLPRPQSLSGVFNTLLMCIPHADSFPFLTGNTQR